MTKQLRDDVEWLISDGMTVRDIAVVLDRTSETVLAHFADELEHGRVRVRAEIIRLLRKSARAGVVSAQKYLDARLLPAPEPKPEPLGKKELLRLEAQTAHEESGWGELVH